MLESMQRIAVLDDDENWCFAVARFFRNDFDVDTFTDTQSFLAASLESYDVVIIDFAISPTLRYERQVSGIDLIDQLKQQLKKPPIMILTSAFISKNDSSIYQELISAADKLLPKDSGLDTILETVKALLEYKKSNQ